MKIAVVTQYFPVREQPYRGHSAFQTLLKLRQWADIEVFAPQSRYPAWLLPKSRSWAKTDLSFTVKEFKTHYFAYPAIPVITRAVNGFSCARVLEPLLRDAKPDVIFSYWIYPDGYASVRVGHKLGIPVVVTSIGSDLNVVSGITRLFAKRTLREADAVNTVSHELALKAVEFGASPDKVHPITNGCDTGIFRPADRALARRELGISANAEVVLYVGRLDVLKGLRELITACAKIAPKRRGLELFLVGEGPAQGELEELASELRFQEHVHFAGACDSSKVSQWMAASDVFALPSYAEGCPNVVLEALNCGRPVVATNVGGIPDMVDEDRGILLPPRNALALAEALETALSHSWDPEEISSRSLRSWEQVARETLDMLEALVQSEPCGAGQPWPTTTLL